MCQLLHGLPVGGAEMVAARLGRGLRDRYRFLFVCLDQLGTLGEELRRDGFDVQLFPRRPGVDGRYPWRLARLLRRERVDLIHAHQYTPFFYAVAARLLYRRPPVLFTEHGRWFPDYPRRKRIFANRLLLQRRDRVVGVGESVRQALIANEGIAADRVQVIYNGIDVEVFARQAADRDAVRQELGCGPEDFVIGQVARFDSLKDHATAIHTLRRVVGECPRARLVLVGDGPELEKTRHLARDLALEPQVRFLGQRSDIHRLLAAADVFLLTSISEGIPLTVIEAMAAGLPVVATSVGGLPEIVVDGQTGWLCPSGDAAALARALLRLANDPAARKEMGRAGRVRAENCFAERPMHAAYERMYDELLHD